MEDALLIFSIAGVLILILTFADFLMTVLWSGGGGGFFTRRLGEGIWRTLLWGHRRRSVHGVLAFAGVSITVLVVLFWFAALLQPRH